MGLIERLFGLLFGGGRNMIAETAEVFRVNAEQESARDAGHRRAALAQFAAEFAPRRGRFDRLVDALNRLPRPAMAFGVLAMFGAAMTDPVWFAARMQGLALVPEPLWWLLGAVVSFYFGARHQVKGQEFQRSIAATMAHAPQVAENIRNLHALRHDSPGAAQTGRDADLTLSVIAQDANPALEDWRRRGRPATM
ncbi:carboxylesterase [Roseovarius sp. TE539]|uniref:holin family protein n=1 Tax=Roseovarius sp. TE539 TaxID=2249812 RepID=UPI000DDE9C59|nr:holin family protein [Roseovarius sp. TE539]RBI75170.1 carboxylesterase [Roseovarius sp. TE539]